MKFDFNATPKFCISLKRSDERRKLVAAEFKKQGLTVSFFDAFDKKDLVVPELSEKIKTDPLHANGILACLLSHVKLITLARDLGLPAICIFEDDVIFCDDFKERIRYIESLPDFDFDFFALGGHFPSAEIKTEDGVQTKHPYIYKTLQHGGTYAYIITDAVYDFVIRNATYNFGADQFYSDILYRRFNCFAFVPFLVSCRVLKSEITDFVWEYNLKWHYMGQPIMGLNKHLNKQPGQ